MTCPRGAGCPCWAHLNELRRRLTICAVCFLVGVALCLSQAEWFTNLLLSRGENFSFVYIAPAELMMTYVRISLVGGVVIIIPVIIYHIWRFLQPGLKRAEQMGFNLIITVGCCCSAWVPCSPSPSCCPSCWAFLHG